MTLLAQVRRWRPSIPGRHFRDGAHKARTRVEVDQRDVHRNVVLHEENLLITRGDPSTAKNDSTRSRPERETVDNLEEIGTNHRCLSDVSMTTEEMHPAVRLHLTAEIT